MKKLWFVIIAAAWMCSAVTSRGQSVPSTAGGKTALTETDLRKILDDARKQANDYYAKEGFPVPAPSPDLAFFKFATNKEYNEPIGKFGPTEQSEIAGEILVTSGKFVSFCNCAASNAAGNSPKLEIPPPAKWTKEHAIDLASRFAHIFIKDWGTSLGHPYARYAYLEHDVDNKTGKSLTAPGQWIVSWMEQTPSGIVYRHGGVSVFLSEKYGPDTVFIHFSAQYEDEHITPIAQDRALIEARKGLDKILAWEPAKQSLGRVQVLDTPPPSAVLMVVQPNNMTKQKDISHMATPSQLKATLGWVVTYKVNAEDGGGSIAVYIDAKDGSFLGGYF